jgi:hypothetical protein
MPLKVRSTVLTDKQIDALRGENRRTHDAFEYDLARRGDLP